MPEQPHPWRTQRSLQGTGRGFTLIELMVAMALIALLFSAAAMGVGAITGAKAREAAAELSSTIRSLYDTANLTGKTCRIVFALPGGREDEGSTRYWAECASGNVTTSRDRDATLRSDTKVAEEELRKNPRGKKSAPITSSRSTYEEVVAREKERVENATHFNNFTNDEVKPHELKNVQVRVWTRHQREAVSYGFAYLYFFPQGFTERAQLYFKQGKSVWTITVSPLTGKTAIVGEELEIPRA